MYTPHPYQETCLQALQVAREQGKKRALVVLATGLGKTFTAALDVKKFLSSSKDKVLFLCNQNTILEQACEEFESMFGKNEEYAFFFGRKKAGAKQARFVFASFQTIHRHKERFSPKEFAYVVVDESHHSHADTYLPVIQHFKPKFLLGITATPDRADLQDIRHIYGKEVFDLPLEEALAQNLLTPVDYHLMTDELMTQDVLDTPAGKMSVKELNRKIFIPKRDIEIAAIINRQTKTFKSPKVMVFCKSIKHVLAMEAVLPNSISIHSRLSTKMQSERINNFRQGKFTYALTVDKFNEGVNFPDVNLVVFLRSTNSATIFFQQLGRGLRKAKDKNKVLILDFVANIERIEMVTKLFREVKERTANESLPRPVGVSETSFEVNSINFDEKVVQGLLDKLKEIRQGYHRDNLAQQLRQISEQLGRNPTAHEIKTNASSWGCASVNAFSRVFGSWQAALHAAGLSKRAKLTFSDEELIVQLRRIHTDTGKIPDQRSLKKVSLPGECVSPAVFQERFGSWNNAITKAGLTPVPQSNAHDRDELISQLKNFRKRTGRIPACTDCGKKNKMACSAAFYRVFGSWHNALKAAGMSSREKGGKYTRAAAIKALKKFYKTHGITPVSNSTYSGEIPSASTCFRIFGSWNKTLKAAGIPLNRKGPKPKN